jgi:hypothetical protein
MNRLARLRLPPRTWRATVALALGVCLAAPADAQTRRTAPRRPAAAAEPATKREPAMMMCPQVLGEGVRTKGT